MVDRLQELLTVAAERAEADGVEADGAFDGPVHRWAERNLSYRPGQEFFVVALLTAELADRGARREGFRDQFDRAAARMRGETCTAKSK